MEKFVGARGSDIGRTVGRVRSKTWKNSTVRKKMDEREKEER